MSATLLAQAGLGKLLGINLPFAAKRHVIAELEIEPHHLDETGSVSSGVIIALADCANSRGAALNLAPGGGVTTIETKAHFLSPGRGRTLRAEATPVHIGNSVSIWRAVVLRDDEQIAEVTQTQVPVAGDQAAVPSPREDGEPRRRSSGEGPISDSFSRDVVDERWQKIVEGASTVIAAKGFAKATIREIAASADMPVATMYQVPRAQRRHSLQHLQALHGRHRVGADALRRPATCHRANGWPGPSAPRLMCSMKSIALSS